MMYEKTEELEIVYSLAAEGKYSEARVVLESLELPPKRKAYINRQIWLMQNRATVVPDTRNPIPAIPVISMILGFVLICAAFACEERIQGPMICVGLFFAAAIPALYVQREKYAADGGSGRHETEAHRYVGEGEPAADINFAKPVPSAGTIVPGIFGVVFLGLGLAAINIFEGTAGDIALSLLCAPGFLMLTLCAKRSRRHNGVIGLGLLTVSASLLFLQSLACMLVPSCSMLFTVGLGIIESLPLLCFPLTFRLLKRRRCTEAVYAECVDMIALYKGHGAHGGSLDPVRYIPFWKYTYNGITYVHRDMAIYKSPGIGDEIWIDPRDPHNIYRGTTPRFGIAIVLAGLCLLMKLLLAVFV